MWPSIMAPQAPEFRNPFTPPVCVRQQAAREYSMFVPSLPTFPIRSFRNPNLINRYRRNVKPVDSSAQNKNSCHIHLIDTIKEKCPEIIPSVEDQEKASIVSVTSDQICEMCLVNNTKQKRQRKREFTHKKKRMGKKSKRHVKTEETSDMMQEEGLLDLSSHSLDNGFNLKPHSLILEDFMALKPPSYVHPPLKQTKHIEPPMTKGSEMLGTHPNRTRQYSVSDSEDSFIVFDNEGSEEHVNEDEDDSKVESRHRRLSSCDSEDSFIMFERNDVESEEDDSCSESSSDDSLEESSSEQEVESCDEVDSSYFIVNRKKVTFASDDQLCKVYPIIKWSYAYQAARKGPWEMYARDRCRFKDRAFRVERDIKYIFDPQHRARIYTERFENL